VTAKKKATKKKAGRKVAAANTETAANARKIAKLLGSEDWKQVRAGFELRRSLGDEILGDVLLGAIEECHERLAECPQEIQITVGAAETEKETVKYTAGDEAWEGWVEHYGKTAVDMSLRSDDAECLAWVVACLKEDRWNSDVPLDCEFPHDVRGQGDCFFYIDKKGKTREGQPKPSKGNDTDVDFEYLESVDSVYEDSRGFGPNGCAVLIEGSEVAEDKIRGLLLALALLASVDIDELPIIPPTPEVE
jgi:hypothetical protein